MIAKAGYRRVVPDAGFAPSLYEAYRRRRCQFGYYLQTRDLFLELHWRLTSNPLLMPTDAATLWSRSEQVRVAGANLSTLPDEDLFLYLCVHGSVHMWFRLKWLVDIAALLQQLRPEAIDRIARRARSSWSGSLISSGSDPRTWAAGSAGAKRGPDECVSGRDGKEIGARRVSGAQLARLAGRADRVSMV